MSNGISSSGIPYNYNYETNTSAIHNNYFSPYASVPPQKPLTMNVKNGANNVNIAGSTSYMKSSSGKMQALLKKAIAPVKKIRVRHVMTAAMFGIIAFSRCGAGSASGNAQRQSLASKAMYEQGYQQGVQHATDSMKVLQLERELQLARDSVKMLKKIK